MKTLTITFSVILLTVYSSDLSGLAAADKKTDAGKMMKITYDDHVKPIFREKCFACHNTDKKVAGLDLSSYVAMMEGGASGTAIEPGSPDDSYLWLLVNHEIEPFMPPKAEKLPADSLKTISKWIELGALENSGSVAKVKKTVDLSLDSAPSGKPDGPAAMPRGVLIDPVVRPERTTAITAIATSPWAPLIAVAAPRQILLYHSQSLEILGVLPFEEGDAKVLKFSRNGELLLGAGGRGAANGKAVVWSVRTGERITEVGDELDTVLAADISADQTMVAIGGPNKIVRVYSTSTSELLYEVKKHTDWIYALEFSPDGVLLATADRNGGMFVWEAHTGRLYGELKGHSKAVTDISWRIDSNIIASCAEDASIKLWELENCKQVKSWNAHGGGTLSVEFARDGRIVSCGRDKVTKLWDQNGAQKVAFPAFADLALSTTIADESNTVVAGDWTGAIKVWNAADGKPVGDLTPNPVTIDQRLEAARAELVTATKNAETQTAALVALQAQVTAMQKQLQQQKAAIETATKQMAAETTAIAAYQKSLGVLSETLKKEEAAQVTLNKVIPLLEESLKNATMAAKTVPADESLIASVKMLTDLVAARKTSLTTSQAATKSASEKKAAETASMKTAEQKLATATAAKAAAEKQVAAVEPTLKATSEKIPGAQKTADDAASALATTKTIVNRLEAYKELKAQYAVLRTHQSQLDELQASLDESEQRVKSSQQAMTEMQTKLDSGKKNLADTLARQKTAADAQLDAQKKMQAEETAIAGLNKLLPALEDARKKTEAAKAAVGDDADVTAALQGLQSALAKRKQELETRKKTSAAELARMKSAEAQAKAEMEKAEAAKVSLAEMTKTMTAQQAELESVRKQFADIAAQVAAAETRLKETQEVVDALRDRVSPPVVANAQAAR